MKKLILVTLLAVAASWLLSEAGQPGDEKAAMTAALDHFKPRHDRVSTRVVLQQGDMASATTVEAPVPPEPPKLPKSIRTVPWRKGDGSKTKKAASGSPAPSAKQVPSPSTKQVPSWFPKSEIEEEEMTRPDASGSRVLVGRVSASEDRARQDLRKSVEREVGDWIAADVPPSWKVPASVLTAMVQGSHVQEVTKGLDLPSTEATTSFDELYTLYRAGQKLDFSSSRRAQIVQMYRQDLATQRMQRLGGGLIAALVGLAVISGYIKADEATKGYYTNRLRLLAAAGLGVAGVLGYRYLV